MHLHDGDEHASERTENPYFNEACILLRSNVISLCFALGMKASDIQPDCALLPNIFLVLQICLKRAQVLSEYTEQRPEDAYSVIESIDDSQRFDVARALCRRYQSLGETFGADRDEGDWLLL